MGLARSTDITFQIERSAKRKKSIAILISYEKGVVVRAPLKTPDHYIQALVKERSVWIQNKLEVMQERRHSVQRNWCSGEILPYLGQQYTLEISPIPAARSQCEIFDTTVFVRLKVQDLKNQEKPVQKLVESWYRTAAKNILENRTEFFAKQMQVTPKEVLIKTQRRRWGSCDRYNNIRYNWKIVMAPMELVDYLVVHELAHIKEKNHSPAFWRVVESAMPDYKVRRALLKAFHADVL